MTTYINVPRTCLQRRLKHYLTFLRHSLSQRPHLHSSWYRVLVQWCSRLEGFAKDCAGSHAYELRSLQVLIDLVRTTSINISDDNLTTIIASHYEGFYWRADGLYSWNSLEEPYLHFKLKQTHHVYDIFVSADTPHAKLDQLKTWLNEALK
ncbi:hypothetical protein [Hydromonas duriensis]|uniref:Uncharacterized protein n=1 Tax=Hydromonas duriensis TaxID=1527608 RepID=A0A4R6Y590_9BURK|nr:hypothetical protein [Hydromonas duriensis]TDR30491.1 hypothetical protein DFR44_1201 [Hydromonas duriensis]